MVVPDAAEAQMAGGSIDWLRHSCRWPIAPRVVRRAQKRAALNNLARRGQVFGCRDKMAEFFVSNGMAVHPEAIGSHSMGRRFLGYACPIPLKSAAWNPYHVLRNGFDPWFRASLNFLSRAERVGHNLTFLYRLHVTALLLTARRPLYLERDSSVLPGSSAINKCMSRIWSFYQAGESHIRIAWFSRFSVGCSKSPI